MTRRVTTLVALVGRDAANVAGGTAAAAANVTHERLAGADDPGAAWRRASAHGSIYTLLDADPLGAVVERWAARLGGGGDGLELAIGSLPEVGVPDYYFVDAGLDQPGLSWYLGLLESLSPRRVVPLQMAGKAVAGALAGLGYGPEFPPLRDLAAMARTYVPAAGRGATL